MFDVILVDFSWIYNKYYYVGKTKAHFGEYEFIPEKEVFNMLHRLFCLIRNSYRNSLIYLVLDPPLSNTHTASLCPEYKGNRDREEKKEVYKHLKGIVGKLSLKLDDKFMFVRSTDYEADQVIAYLAEKFCNKHDVLIFSGDKDLLQLTYHERVDISEKYEKGAFLIKTDEEIFQKFKNNKGEDFTRISEDKRDILKYRTLKGDPSDNLCSVFPRVKDTDIVKIIKNYWLFYEPLTEDRIIDIINKVEKEDSKLSEKLRENKDIWLRNYLIMNLYDIKDVKVKKVKKHG